MSLMLISCNGGDFQSGSTVRNDIEIRLNNGFLLTYGRKVQKRIIPMKYTISVDRYKGDGKLDKNFTSAIVIRNNDDEDDDILIFKNISVPKEGSFAITVTADAVNTSCFDGVPASSCGNNKGKVMFRDISAVLKSGETPQVLYLFPSLSLLY